MQARQLALARAARDDCLVLCEVLELGQNAYRPSRSQRRALKHQHTHCAFPGCDRSLNWCDIHHLVPWAQNPVTTVDNVVPLPPAGPRTSDLKRN